MAKRKYCVEAQEPCGNKAWVELKHPDFYKSATYEAGGTHDGLFVASSPEEAIRQWIEAYPAYPDRLAGGAKPYLGFRAFPVTAKRPTEYVLVKREVSA